ncbi:MAG: RluA family pseudouridine synthase [Candidatus Cyclobacteriaceae bacterium M2_1C_046]
MLKSPIETHIVPASVIPSRFSDYAVGVFENLPSRKSVKKAIKSGDLKVNKAPASTGLWIQPGMTITYEPEGDTKPAFELEVPVIYEDDFLAIVNKPAGILTSGNKFRTLENALNYNLYKSNQPSVLLMPRPVHRLDYGTSGLILIAKTPKARIMLGRMLEKREVDKRYHAIVHGEVIPEEERINSDIEGKPALSIYRLVKQSVSKRYSLLELSPETGRTHQLRIHCARSGFPIVGDQQYGLDYDPGKGLFLSATGLTFSHPITGELIAVKIELPGKFNRLLKI